MPEPAAEAGPSQATLESAQQNIQSDQDSAPLLDNSVRETSEAQSESASTFSQRFSTFFKSLAWRAPASTQEAITEAQPQASASEEAERSEASVAGASAIPVLAERPAHRGALDIESGSEIEGAASAPTRSSSSAPVCLICLETLAAEDFASGRAISLGCHCRGDLALRHRDCAQKWAQVKDDGRGGVPVCELCKHPVRNLPPLPPRPRPAPEEALGLPPGTTVTDVYGDPASFASFAPSTADLVFDCIRVTWVAMIVSILFFEASLGSALWTGLVAGMAYSLMVRVMYRQHFEAMRAYAEQHAAARQQLDPSGGQVPVHVV